MPVTVAVLGTAQDGGVPQAGCYCPNCRRAREDGRYGRMTASLGLYDFGERKAFLIDATPDIRSQLDRMHNRFDRAGAPGKDIPDGVILSHAHIGHYTGLVFFGFESLNTKNLAVYGSPRMAAFLAGNQPWRFMVESGNLSLKEMAPDEPVILTSRLKIVPFKVPHRDELSDTLGFAVEGPIKKLLYIPDIRNWESWPGSFPDFVSKADYALLDGTFFGRGEVPERDLTAIGHPLIEDSLELLGPVPAKGKTKILFTHFNHSNPVLDPKSLAREDVLSAGFAVAEEGQGFIL
jgi:pyrroloquinoline quinone biosynthesis protein B